MHAVSQRKMLFSVVRGTNFTTLLSQHLSYTCDHIVEKGSSLHTVKMVSVEHNTISSTKGLEFVVWLHRKHYYSSYEPWRERGFGTKTRDLSVVWHKKAPVPVQLKVTNLFPSSNPLIFSSKVSPINTNIFENKIWRKLRTPPPKIRPNTRYCVECWPGEVGPSPVYLHTKSWRATKKKQMPESFSFQPESNQQHPPFNQPNQKQTAWHSGTGAKGKADFLEHGFQRSLGHLGK